MPMLLTLVWNHAERRLRAVWRLLIAMSVGLFGIGVLRLVALGVITFLLMATAQVPFGALRDGPALRQAINAAFRRLPILDALRSVLVLVLVIALARALARWLDHRDWRDYGFHLSAAWWRDFAFGIGLGLVLMGAIFGVELAAGWLSVTGVLANRQPDLPFWQLLVNGLFAYVFVGVAEELFTRGYLIRNLAEGLRASRAGARAAVLIAFLLTSLFFGLLHLSNANATLVSTAYLALAGVFLGLGYVLTGELAIPIGLHIAWNFAQGYVFGFPVSGASSRLSLLATQQTGPSVWTGGAFGPEAGLVGLFAILLGTVLTYGWVRWTHRRATVQAQLAEYAPPPPCDVAPPARRCRTGRRTPPAGRWG